MANFDKNGKKIHKAVNAAQKAGYTVLTQDGTVLMEEAPVKPKKRFPKKIATLAGVATAGLAGGILAGKAFFSKNAYVEPDLVESVADALNVAADAVGEEAVSVAEEVVEAL